MTGRTTPIAPESSCIACEFWCHDDEPVSSLVAEHRETVARWGVGTAIGGPCSHRDSRSAGGNSISRCDLWTPRVDPHGRRPRFNLVEEIAAGLADEPQVPTAIKAKAALDPWDFADQAWDD